MSEADAVFPDERIDSSWRSFSTGKDAALHWILAQPFPDRRKRSATASVTRPREDTIRGLAHIRHDGDVTAGDRTANGPASGRGL